jgi:hypothetical protein
MFEDSKFSNNFEFKSKKRNLFQKQIETKQLLKQHILLRNQQRQSSIEYFYENIIKNDVS